MGLIEEIPLSGETMRCPKCGRFAKPPVCSCGFLLAENSGVGKVLKIDVNDLLTGAMAGFVAALAMQMWLKWPKSLLPGDYAEKVIGEWEDELKNGG